MPTRRTVMSATMFSTLSLAACGAPAVTTASDDERDEAQAKDGVIRAVPMASLRRERRGMSLLEVMVALAIILSLTAIIGLGMQGMFGLDQRKGALKLAVMYERLQDEAVMRNRTYRIVYFLNEAKYVIEAGEPGALIAADPTAREQYERDVADKLSRMDDDERMRWLRKNKQPFQSLAEGRMEVELPPGTVFGGIYSPQYGEMVVPDGEDDEDQRQRVETYVMSNGFSEHTLIWIVDEANPDDGYTVEVHPMSGVVDMHPELIEWQGRLAFVPDEGPDLPN